MLRTGIDGLTLRRAHASDLEALVRYANNRHVWINLKDRFPYPYTESDARAWIVHCDTRTGDPTNLTIDWQGEAIGGVGLEPYTDVHRLTASVGYWVGEPFWGRGFATQALMTFTSYAFATFDLQRLQATVFDWNHSSARVLEKAGYVLEGRLRRSIIKDGRVADTLLYARLRDDWR
jgi:RimJ/RimL family protein N-acetyltransferase